MKGRQKPRRLPQPPLGAIAHHRPTDPTRCCETNPHEGLVIPPPARLGADGAPCTG